MLNCVSIEKELLLRYPDLNIKINEPMSRHCSFHIGGTAGMLIKPSTIKELTDILAFLKANDIRFKIIGAGTNLLITDNHIDAVIIQTTGLSDIRITDNILYAECGCSMSRAAVSAYNNALTGMEFAHGIPGTIGGGVYMNAGAYGGEISQILLSTEYIDSNGNIHEISNKDHMFSYRHSIFVDNPSNIILSAKFQLSCGNKDEIKDKMDDLHFRRKDKQPLEYPSAGSSFKRPQGYFAGALIEECGLKGCTIGGAQVSEKHAGFIINIGNATCSDVLKLIDHIKTEVYNKHGIMLECEPEFLE